MTLSLRRILVPTDFSEASTEALTMAIEFARRFDAAITIFHAHSVPSFVFPDGMLAVTPQLMQDLERSIEGELKRVAATVAASGVVVTTHHAIGAPYDEICRYADELGADLIVMGTHGHTGLRHAILGSVAEKVVRKAHCPVLTVSPSASAAAHAVR